MGDVTENRIRISEKHFADSADWLWGYDTDRPVLCVRTGAFGVSVESDFPPKTTCEIKNPVVKWFENQSKFLSGRFFDIAHTDERILF